MVHPKALTPLFLTEMWERFGFYIAQGLLVLFLTKFYQFSDQQAYTLLGAFTAMVYITPLMGGFIADRLLGYRYAILLGACLLCVGYALAGTLKLHLFYIGLACVIVGNGFLKPNISSYLGEFYTPQDTRRDAGFTIFYIGINIGTILSTLSSGFVKNALGWNSVFIAAAIGMAIAIGCFLLGYDRYADYGLPIPRDNIKPPILARFANKSALTFLVLVSIFLCHALLERAVITNILLGVIGCLTLVGLLVAAAKLEPKTRNKMIALLVLITLSILFWSLFFQLFFSMNLFIDRAVDRTVGGIHVPSVAFISLESIFIILLGPFFALLWRRLQQRGKDIATPTKFALALICIAISTQLLVLGIQSPSLDGLINPWWIVIAYFVVTVGELLLSPIGLSMVTILAPDNIKGLMMGVWFMGLGFGGSLAGLLAQKADVPFGITNLSSIEHIYAGAFQTYTWLALVVGIGLLCLVPTLKRLMGNLD